MNVLLILLALLQAPGPSQEQKPQEKPPETLFKSLAKQVTIGGQARFRAEYRDPIGYATAAELAEDDDVYLSRLRVNLKWAVNDAIDVFIQPQDARTFGEEASVLSNDRNFDLHQGWVEIRGVLNEPITLRIGRQELQYGDQRLLSPLDWSNISRAWDGVKIAYTGDGYAVDAFYTVIKEGSGAEDDQDFYGVYASYRGWEGHEVDGYVLARRLANNAFTDELGNVGDVKDRTIGARLKGKTGALDYTLEAATQFGDFVETDIRAFGLAATLGWSFADLEWKPRVGAEVTYASGDDDPADGDRGTFDPLFPFQHYYQGFADVFAWKNGLDVALYLKAAPAEGFSLHADVHNFWLVEERDAWYAASGAAIRRDVTGRSDERVGTEIDLHARATVDKSVKLWGGFSYFVAGPFVGDTGRDPDTKWFFLQMVVDF